MKFTLTKTHRYWWPVKVRVPDPDQPGKILEQELKLQFEARDREASIASQEAYAKLKTPREQADAEVAELRAICRNWDGVVDGNGNPVEFTDEAFALALSQAWFRIAVWEAHNKSLLGIEAPAEGN